MRSQRARYSMVTSASTMRSPHLSHGNVHQLHFSMEVPLSLSLSRELIKHVICSTEKKKQKVSEIKSGLEDAENLVIRSIVSHWLINRTCNFIRLLF